MIENDRLIAPEAATPQEDSLERALRPKVLDEYVGQEKARGQLEIFINAARSRAELVSIPQSNGRVIRTDAAFSSRNCARKRSASRSCARSFATESLSVVVTSATTRSISTVFNV